MATLFRPLYTCSYYWLNMRARICVDTYVDIHISDLVGEKVELLSCSRSTLLFTIVQYSFVHT